MYRLLGGELGASGVGQTLGGLAQTQARLLQASPTLERLDTPCPLGFPQAESC